MCGNPETAHINISSAKSSVFENITFIYLLLMSFVFPLWCGTKGYAAIAYYKFSLFCALGAAYAAVMLLYAVQGLVTGTVRPVSPAELIKRSNAAQKLVVLYLLITWLSALLSPLFPQTVIGVSRSEGAVTISVYCVSFLLVSVFGRARKELLAAYGVSVSLFCVLCLIQLAGKNPLSLYPAGMNYYDGFVKYGGQFLGTMGNTNFCAAFLCCAAPVFWICLLRLRGRARFLLLIPLALSLAALFAMHVAYGTVFFAAGSLLSLPIVIKAGKKTRRIVLAAVICLFVLCLLFLYFRDFGQTALHETHLLLHGEVLDTFGSNRVRIWKHVLAAMPGRWLLGSGPDTMLLAELTPFTRYDESLGGMLTSYVDAAHNEYLNVLFHQGMFALLAFLGMIVWLIIKWTRKSRGSAAAAALGGAVLCYALQALFGISTCISAPFFWLSAALLCRLVSDTSPR